MTAPEAPATGAETGTTTATPPETPPDYKALYEAAQAERDELSGKYDAQKRVNRQIEQRYKNQQGAGQQAQPATPSTGNDDADKLKDRAEKAEFEAHVLRLASNHSPEATRLLDSIAFREAVNKLEFDDRDELEKKFLALVDKKLPKKPAVQSTSGGEFAGGSGAASPITEAQLKGMTKPQIADAYEKGLLSHLM